VGRAACCRDIAAIPPLRDPARQKMPGRSGRDEQSRKGTGLKTGVYKSKPKKNRTLENQGCGTRVGALCLDLKT